MSGTVTCTGSRRSPRGSSGSSSVRGPAVGVAGWNERRSALDAGLVQAESPVETRPQFDLRHQVVLVVKDRAERLDQQHDHHAERVCVRVVAVLSGSELGEVLDSIGLPRLAIVEHVSGSGRPAEERAYAESLEADAVEFPEERTQCLQEAVAAWRRGGRPERAYELLDQMVADGGPDGCFARAQRIDYLLADGRDEDAAPEIVALARDPELNDGPCQIMAELFTERDELEEAAKWYDRAIARLDARSIDALHGPAASFSVAAIVVRGRRKVREALGLPRDRMDELVPRVTDLLPTGTVDPHRRSAASRGGRVRSSADRGLSSRGACRGAAPLAGGVPRQRRGVLHRSRAQWRELRDAGASGVTVVPL